MNAHTAVRILGLCRTRALKENITGADRFWEAVHVLVNNQDAIPFEEQPMNPHKGDTIKPELLEVTEKMTRVQSLVKKNKDGPYISKNKWWIGDELEHIIHLATETKKTLYPED